MQESLFDDAADPALRPRTRAELILAYMEELAEHPPVATAAGNTPEAERARRRFAERDVARVERAAARLGCRLQLVALQESKGAKP